MERNINMDEISDGKLYGLNDMVKADCQDCKDCSACCCGMGNSIILDPLDIYRLTTGLNKSFEELLNGFMELNVADGVILPNLKMAGAGEKCAFLSNDGRCSIHNLRPGICRLFPLGRFYENGTFRYFLQIHECKMTNRTKIKVKKWIDTPNIKENERFINDWHYFIKEIQQKCRNSMDEQYMKQINMEILNDFYIKSYDGSREFYEQFYDRFQKYRQV